MFEGVIDTMSVVIGRIDAPFITYMWVWRVLNAICDWISHRSLIMSHVDFHAQAHCILLVLPLSHVSEHLQIVLNGSVSKWRIFLESSILFYFLGTLLTHKCLPSFDQLFR